MDAAEHPGSYRLRCRCCGRTLADDGYVLTCPSPHEPALLVPAHADRRFHPDQSTSSLFRYSRWLPVRRSMAGGGRTVVFRSDWLARLVGVAEVWVGFNGWWPERGASLPTATFKELEAWTVLARLPESPAGTLVLASAGNTAAAFARACSATGVRCVIIVPESALAHLCGSEPIAPWVKLVTLPPPADYADAIVVAGWLAELDGYYPEGGVRNVARRAGLGTVLLAAVEAMGRLPEYYFQAVGSGAGAIGVHEAAERLRDDGRWGKALPRLMLSQNLPFTPLYDSWRAGGRALVRSSPEEARRRVAELVAPVLSNREPPYAVRGGVYDVLCASGGDMLTASSAAAREAGALFQSHEGIDMDPAGAVALASLLHAGREGRLASDATVLLNVTGGGRERLRRSARVHAARPSLRFSRSDLRRDETLERVAAL